MGARLSYPAVDLGGKVALVTGGNTGIGYETSKALAVMGAHTIIACRSEERATTAIERMKQEVSNELPEKQINVEFMHLDLSSFHSTKQFVSAFHEKRLPLHMLINNAGVAHLPQLTSTADGHESQFQVNHLSPFLLTLELLPTVLETAASSGDCRIVFVSSRAHTRAVWNPNNLNGEQSYSWTTFYNNSKLYNVMTAYALQRRLSNVGVTVSCLHPGIVNTELFRHWDNTWYLNAVGKVIKPTFRNCKDGAATTINCAVNPELSSQQCFYYADCRPAQPTATARDEQLQEQLWEISVKAVKEYLSPAALEKYGPTHQERTDQSDSREGGGGVAQLPEGKPEDH